MTSSNRNIFRFIGLLCGEFTGHLWIPHAKASDAELWCFLLSAPEPTVEQTMETLVIGDATALIYYMIVMIWTPGDSRVVTVTDIQVTKECPLLAYQAGDMGCLFWARSMGKALYCPNCIVWKRCYFVLQYTWSLLYLNWLSGIAIR